MQNELSYDPKIVDDSEKAPPFSYTAYWIGRLKRGYPSMLTIARLSE
jgi:hypothetical protein